jgi:hypothetical protein
VPSVALARATSNTTRSVASNGRVALRRPGRAPVDRLPADPRHFGDDGGRAALRDELAGMGDALSHSRPRKSSPAISTSIVLRPSARSRRGDLAAQLVGFGALALALQPLGAGRQKLLAPFPEQAVSDVVLAAKLGDRLRAAQRREHDLGLLLGGELPVPARVAQRGAPSR